MQPTQTIYRCCHPFGMVMPTRSFVAGSDYKYGFNGKESDDETYGDGNVYDYGFRIYNPRLGKFLSVDPLTRTYAMLTPYQFASNSPIMAIDIDGLEGEISIAGQGNEASNYGKKDAEVFMNRAKKLEKGYGMKAMQVSSGKEFIDALITTTELEGSIQTVFVLSHGTVDGIVLNWNSGFYSTQNSYTENDDARTVADLQISINSGLVKFEVGAVIIVGACSVCGPVSERNFAEDLTITTGITTISPTGLFEPEIINGVETGNYTTTGTFMKNDMMYDVKYTQDDKEISKPFTNKYAAEIYRDIIKSDYNIDSSIEERLEPTKLGGTLNPADY